MQTPVSCGLWEYQELSAQLCREEQIAWRCSPHFFIPIQCALATFLVAAPCVRGDATCSVLDGFWVGILRTSDLSRLSYCQKTFSDQTCSSATISPTRYRPPRTPCIQIRPLRSIAVAPRAMVAPGIAWTLLPIFLTERSCGSLLARRHRMRQDDSSPQQHAAAAGSPFGTPNVVSYLGRRLDCCLIAAMSTHCTLLRTPLLSFTSEPML